MSMTFNDGLLLDALAESEAELASVRADLDAAREALREFEKLPVRRSTQGTVVFERGPLDDWRAKAGALAASDPDKQPA